MPSFNNISDAAGIQSANDQIVAGGTPQDLVLAPGIVIPVSQTLTIDLSLVNLRGERSTLDASGMTGAGPVIRAVGNAVPVRQWQGVNNLRIIGPGPESSVVGILFESRDGTFASAQLAHHNLLIQSCGTAIQIGVNAYIHNFYSPIVSGNGFGVHLLAVDNSGENIAIIGGVVDDNRIAFVNDNPSSEINVIGTSVDYNRQVAVMAGGRLLLTSPHVELRGADVTLPNGVTLPGVTAPQFVLTGNGTGVIWRGGSRVVTIGQPHTFAYWVDAGVETFFDEDGVQANNDRTSTNTFATGAGLIQRGSIESFDIHENCFFLHATRSRIIDPTFTDPRLPDNIVIRANAGDYRVTSRLTEVHTVSGPVTTLSLDAGRLKYSKMQQAGYQSAFSLLVPVRGGELIGGGITFEKPGNQTGTFFINYNWVRVNPNNPLTPLLPEVVTIAGIAGLRVDFTTDAIGPTVAPLVGLMSQKAPHGAEYLEIAINGDSINAGDLFFSAPNFDRIA